MWPYPPRLRPVLAIVVKGDFPETFSVYLELMEVGEGRTKIPQVGKFYEYMLPPNQIWAHNSFSFKSYACTFAGNLADFNHNIVIISFKSEVRHPLEPFFLRVVRPSVFRVAYGQLMLRFIPSPLAKMPPSA